jgi:hypothetical protein
MKSIFTLLVSSIFSLSSFAFRGAQISISSISNEKVVADVNGRLYYMDDKGISVQDLQSGFYTIKIYTEKKKNNGNKHRDNASKGNDLIYNNRVYLRDGQLFDMRVNRNGNVEVRENLNDRIGRRYNEDDDFDNNRSRNRDYRDNRYENDYNKAMSFHEFGQVRESLKRIWLERSRVTAARQILDRNYFLSWQIKELLLLFSSENSKLELAKHAYSSTTDKQAFYIVNDVFTFNRSKDELARYIREYRY